MGDPRVPPGEVRVAAVIAWLNAPGVAPVRDVPARDVLHDQKSNVLAFTIEFSVGGLALPANFVFKSLQPMLLSGGSVLLPLNSGLFRCLVCALSLDR